MRKSQKRDATRSPAWPETKACLQFVLPNGNNLLKNYKSSGDVIDIGSCGMFVKTKDLIPISTNLNITICFDSEADSPKLLIDAQGEVARSTSNGVGIRFTEIDLDRLRRCLISKINRSHLSITETIDLDELAAC